MKRRNDDEKTMTPMFPRLHVNDADKAGPKAPPRNKMALYEQFSIPSQRFNSTLSTLTSTQVSGHEKYFPLHVSPSTHTHHEKKFHDRLSDLENVNTSFTQREFIKKFGEEDDFMVPVFVQSVIGHDISRDKGISPGSKPLGRSLELENGCDKLGHEVMRKSNDENDQIRTYSTKIATKQSGDKEIDGLVEEEGELRSKTIRDSPADSFRKLSDSESTKDKQKNSVLQSGNGYGSKENSSDSKEIANETGHSVDRTQSTSQLEYAGKTDAVSETSMFASVSGLDITPDDVVGVIGQKHFWKARRAIMNQQRVFAGQVFELHRLVKVQMLMAESPNLLLEDGAPMANLPLTASPTKKLPSEYIAKTKTHLANRGISEKTNHIVECSAENAVGKTPLTSLSSVKTSTYGPYSENPKPGDRCFHQTPGHQWLIPVMSPSEGLVYKPYPAPGPASMAYGSVINPAYMSPYGIPFVNPSPSGSAVELVSWYPRPGSNDQSGQISAGFSPFQLKTQSSCNMQAEKVEGSKEIDLQVSTATSSPIEKGWGGGKDKTSKGRDPLPLFPVATAREEPRQVIRVVPHNRRSATESAARIFRSIQQERQHND